MVGHGLIHGRQDLGFSEEIDESDDFFYLYGQDWSWVLAMAWR